MRNMSFALTTAQVLNQSKDVTRRLGWLMLKPGDLIQPVKKCMGLKPGEKLAKLGGPIRIVSVRREPLNAMLAGDTTVGFTYGYEEVRREGFADHPEYCSPLHWCRMFCDTHKGCDLNTVITRIEFSYEVHP